MFEIKFKGPDAIGTFNWTPSEETQTFLENFPPERVEQLKEQLEKLTSGFLLLLVLAIHAPGRLQQFACMNLTRHIEKAAQTGFCTIDPSS